VESKWAFLVWNLEPTRTGPSMEAARSCRPAGRGRV